MIFEHVTRDNGAPYGETFMRNLARTIWLSKTYFGILGNIPVTPIEYPPGDYP